MGLSRNVVRMHIDRWEPQLGDSNRPYRKVWPSRLFRHEPLENTIKILQSGVLLSRTAAKAAGLIVRDIAPQEIIGRTTTAHASARLYFRPKSPTQYHIEGIQKPNELRFEDHAPVLVILIFGAQDILTQDGIRFSDRNMQSPNTATFSSDADFEALPFDQIYHDGVFDPRSELGADIKRRRCAEVLVPSPLRLEGNLQGILCRSPAERSTLLHLLGEAADRWKDRIRVYTKPGLFENRYAYLDTVDGSPTGVAFTFHPRRDGAHVATQMWVRDASGVQIMSFGPTQLDPAKPWRSSAALGPGTYLARFEVEGCLAYEAPFIVEELPF